MLDYACLHNQRDTPQQTHSPCGKGRKGKSIRELQRVVRKKVKRQV
jgi:hypothetical protein